MTSKSSHSAKNDRKKDHKKDQDHKDDHKSFGSFGKQDDDFGKKDHDRKHDGKSWNSKDDDRDDDKSWGSKDDDCDDDKSWGNKDDDWHHGGTKDHVAGQTGAAKDDSFTVDNADTLVLDVLANDPGSARLWSIDQDALAGDDCEYVQKDLDSVTLASGATLTVNADGTLSYAPPASVANLPEGEVFTDSFTYVIRMAKGALSSAQAQVNITGTYVEVNTPATFSGDATGSVDEDGTTDTVSGTLQVNDSDAGEAAFAATGDLQGDFGLFSFDLASGEWSYLLDNDNALVQGLDAGETLTETLQVQSVDGSSTQLSITINGQDEAPADPALLWLLSNVTNDVTQIQSGEVTPLIPIDPNNSFVLLTGFTSNDVLNHRDHILGGHYEDDVTGDGVNDTVVSFNYVQGGELHVVDVALISFVGLNEATNLATGLVSV